MILVFKNKLKKGGLIMGRRKYTYQEVYNMFLAEGYTLLSKEYINNKQQLNYICPNNHKHHITLANFNYGYRCTYCYGNVKFTYNQVKEYIESFGYKLLSTECVNVDTKLNLKCPIDHEYPVTFYKFKNRGQRCPYCNGKHTYEQVKRYIKDCGYELLSAVYINNKTPLDIKCSKNHIFHPTLDNFQRGTRCPHCVKKYKGEEKVSDILNNLNLLHERQYKFKNCKNNRPLPFDFYLPDYNVCIEYNGEYHYEPVDYSGKGKEWAENKFKHTQKVDNIKRNYCKDNNIKLIEIPYWELNNIEEILKKELNI